MESGPSRCPPLITTAAGPRSAIRLAASFAVAIESTWTPHSAAASDTFGVTTSAFGSSRVFNIETASGARRVRVRRPPLASTGSTTRWARGNRPVASAAAQTISAVASMPVLMAATSTSRDTASICARTSDAGSAKTSSTPVVFCAVTAVSAETPCAPKAAKVFRSAWIPAPPIESLPAMVSAVRMGGPAPVYFPKMRKY
jgi:hypothetical protein